MALRINDIKLPLDHGDADLRVAVLALQGILAECSGPELPPF